MSRGTCSDARHSSEPADADEPHFGDLPAGCLEPGHERRVDRFLDELERRAPRLNAFGLRLIVAKGPPPAEVASDWPPLVACTLADRTTVLIVAAIDDQGRMLTKDAELISIVRGDVQPAEAGTLSGAIQQRFRLVFHQHGRSTVSPAEVAHLLSVEATA